MRNVRAAVREMLENVIPSQINRGSRVGMLVLDFFNINKEIAANKEQRSIMSNNTDDACKLANRFQELHQERDRLLSRIENMAAKDLGAILIQHLTTTP